MWLYLITYEGGDFVVIAHTEEEKAESVAKARYHDSIASTERIGIAVPNLYSPGETVCGGC